jgi:hypothetical protein
LTLDPFAYAVLALVRANKLDRRRPVAGDALTAVAFPAERREAPLNE